MKDYTLFEKFMRSADDGLLEEAKQPRARRRNWVYAAGTLAACLLVAAGLLVWKPWQTGDIRTKGSEPMATARIANPLHDASAEELAQLGYDVAVPQGAENVAYTLIDNGENVPLAQVTYDRDGLAYTYRGLIAGEPEDISGVYESFDEELSWPAAGLDMRLCASEGGWAVVSWYEPATGTQWCLAAEGEARKVLTTARDILNVTGIDIAAAPEGAQDVTYDAFPLNGRTVAETRFTWEGRRWTYRMAATGEIGLEDISGTGLAYAVSEDGVVAYCDAKLFYDEGGAGKIIWFDVVPGMLYSLTVETGASAALLAEMANSLFTPLQGDVG